MFKAWVLCVSVCVVLTVGCRKSEPQKVVQTRTQASPAALVEHCLHNIGAPRVEKLGDRIFVAIGYDLANMILVRTEDGNVVIDAGMSPTRSKPARDALLKEAPGAIKALIFTHSHIDHVGGASVFAGEDTDIWATEAFSDHFLKQYGALGQAESIRGARQFGNHVDLDALPCSALGRRIDLAAALETGALLPTKTFSGQASFSLGGLTFELVEAHGETHDQLFVFIPELRALFPGDNYYAAFPNLYTIRGTSPRPVKKWVQSIDAMRRRAAKWMVPSHTIPVEGEAEVADLLTRYRDGIQWVRDRVIAGANTGADLDTIVESIGLPPSLAETPSLRELYGQIDWSARAIFTNNLGWFDGRPEALYPVPRAERAKRTVSLMGGAATVVQEIERAIQDGQGRWAMHWVALLRDAEPEHPELSRLTDVALTLAAEDVTNTNGRGYLLESAHEARGGARNTRTVGGESAMLDSIPMSYFFDVMMTRLKPAQAGDVHESVAFHFTDTDERFFVTVRHGVAEIASAEPLPGTPEPIATAKTTTTTWRRLALGIRSPLRAIASGDLSIEGSRTAFRTFMNRFERRF